MIGIISSDLYNHGKLSLILLILVLISALLVVTITYYTRKMITERETMILEQEMIDIEWRNLLIEENVLADHSRIEAIARKQLNMEHIDPSKEKIVLIH
ncbi:Cell division protein [Candidatus Palibaumannia cicadellinicola]|uniref:Cell division protein FtsL n=1 Tax=Candidatus Palibaumannia cicadellinicola TaxID=186490 RepID=A0A0K2BL06_9GAMM|nr:Cell division protein [Candidatus Baumannia cicadellinicola]